MSSARNLSRGRHAVAAPTGQQPDGSAKRRQKSSGQLKKSLTMAFAFIASAGFIAVNAVDPSGAMASADLATQQSQFTIGEGQSVTTTDGYSVAATGESYVAEAKKVAPAFSPGSLPHIVPDPGSAQAIAKEMLLARGWGEDEFSCLVELWKRESGWRVNAHNVGSGAYGIPQALPGEKMASAGADWQTNPATQIAWGLGYVGGRYGTPCGAWASFQDKGWY